MELHLATFKPLTRERYRCNQCRQMLRASELNRHRSVHLPPVVKPRVPKVPTIPDAHRAQRQIEHAIPASSVWRWWE
jgi:hypothetical protein